MEQISIKSHILNVTINLKGAEVRSVKNITTEHEYMWNADETVWSGVSPVLFPVVGKTTNGELQFNGISYPQGNHGFARNAIFKISEHSASSVTLSIITNELNKNEFPFNLEFSVIYTIIGNQLNTIYQVKNLDSQTGYFSVGAHPAFRCPFDNNHDISDYIIEFENHETNLIHHEITTQAFFTGKTTHTPLQTISLNQNTFVDDAIIYNNFTSHQVSLKEKQSNRMIKVSLDGFSWLGLWSKPGADYVCIEPWCGHSDYLGFHGNINEKEAIESILPNEVWRRQYNIDFSY